MRSPPTTPSRDFCGRATWPVVPALIALGLSMSGPTDARALAAGNPPSADGVPPADTLRGPGYYSVGLRPLPTSPTRARGRASLRFPDSPFTVVTTPEGFYVWEFVLEVWDLPRRPNTVFVAWLAAPDLDPLRRIGVVEEGTVLTGRVDFGNQFLLFVTAERTPDVVRPRGRTVLRGISRSGYLDSMFGHGFCPRDEEC